MQSFPFDSYVTYDSQGNPTYDRAVSSQPLRTLIRKLFTTGVMPNPSTNFQVNAGTDGMTVLVQPGFAVVDGGLCKEDEVRTLSVTAADSTYDRIDTVVLRWNENVDVRTADLYVLAGTPAETPIRPTLKRAGSIYEIGLADVFITHGIVTITEDKITDTRYESERCGIVSSVSEWDTTTIYQQIQSELAKFKSVEEVAFTNWFESVKDQLDEDAAGHLQNEIDKHTKDISDVNGRLTQVQSQIVPTASIESGANASKAYNVGDFLVKDGILYKVTNAISKGDALTGERIDVTTVSNELNSPDKFIKKMKLLGRSSNSNVVELNESYKKYDAIYVSSFTNTTIDATLASTSIFAFSEDINVGNDIALLKESIYTAWNTVLLTISSETSFKVMATNKKAQFYTTVIGINL